MLSCRYINSRRKRVVIVEENIDRCILQRCWIISTNYKKLYWEFWLNRIFIPSFSSKRKNIRIYRHPMWQIEQITWQQTLWFPSIDLRRTSQPLWMHNTYRRNFLCGTFQDVRDMRFLIRFVRIPFSVINSSFFKTEWSTNYN